MQGPKALDDPLILYVVPLVLGANVVLCVIGYFTMRQFLLASVLGALYFGIRMLKMLSGFWMLYQLGLNGQIVPLYVLLVIGDLLVRVLFFSLFLATALAIHRSRAEGPSALPPQSL